MSENTIPQWPFTSNQEFNLILNGMAKRRKKINSKKLRKLLRRKTGAKNIILLDRKYTLYSRPQVENILEKSLVDKKKFEADFGDCDDYAVQLWGYETGRLGSGAFGIVFSKEHAFNIFMDKKHRVWLIEPQNDRIFRIDQIPNDMYKPLVFVMM